MGVVAKVCVYCRTGVMELVGSTWHCRCGAWVHEEEENVNPEWMTRRFQNSHEHT